MSAPPQNESTQWGLKAFGNSPFHGVSPPAARNTQHADSSAGSLALMFPGAVIRGNRLISLEGRGEKGRLHGRPSDEDQTPHYVRAGSNDSSDGAMSSNWRAATPTGTLGSYNEIPRSPLSEERMTSLWYRTLYRLLLFSGGVCTGCS